MKCFQHPQVDAVAICKNCHKGLCTDCAADLGNGVACKGRCEAEVAALSDLQQRNKTAFEKAAGHFMRAGIMTGLIGLFLSASGVVWWNQGGWFSFLFGAVFLLGAFFMFGTSRRYRSVN